MGSKVYRCVFGMRLVTIYLFFISPSFDALVSLKSTVVKSGYLHYYICAS